MNTAILGSTEMTRVEAQEFKNIITYKLQV